MSAPGISGGLACAGQRNRPVRVLMTLDAVGGVWRYAMELARALSPLGIECVFAGFGPEPDPARRREAAGLGRMTWTGLPLDWMVENPTELGGIADAINRLADLYETDLVHLNLPSQACGATINRPTVVVSHSCVVTWFKAVRATAIPGDWQWQRDYNRAGFDAADAVLAPSRSHAGMLAACYGAFGGLSVVHNASATPSGAPVKENFVLAAGRWWDDGKNGAVLDEAAARIDIPVIMAGPRDGPTGQHLAIRHAQTPGELPHDLLNGLMRRAAIVCSPSLYEPFGLAALEGALAGAALVLADIPTYRELWDGAALFADPRNPEAFAEAIGLLHARPDIRALHAHRAHNRAQAFSPSAQALAMADVYFDVLASRELSRTKAH